MYRAQFVLVIARLIPKISGLGYPVAGMDPAISEADWEACHASCYYSLAKSNYNNILPIPQGNILIVFGMWHEI